MNLALNTAAVSLIHKMVSTGQFETPESVVETALFQAFTKSNCTDVVAKQISMDPLNSIDEGIVIELPYRAGAQVAVLPTTMRCIPDPVELAPRLQ